MRPACLRLSGVSELAGRCDVLERGNDAGVLVTLPLTHPLIIRGWVGEGLRRVIFEGSASKSRF